MKYIKVSWPESQKFSDMKPHDGVYVCAEEDGSIFVEETLYNNFNKY